MEKRVINHFIDCINKNRTRMLIEKNDKCYIMDGFCIFIIDKKEMILNPNFFTINNDKAKIIISRIKEEGYKEMLLKYYLPVGDITYHKYICEGLEVYLNGEFIKLFGKFDKVEAIDSESLVRISIKKHIIGYLMPIRLPKNY